jgi:hypothetical protein
VHCFLALHRLIPYVPPFMLKPLPNLKLIRTGIFLLCALALMQRWAAPVVEGLLPWFSIAFVLVLLATLLKVDAARARWGQILGCIAGCFLLFSVVVDHWTGKELVVELSTGETTNLGVIKGAEEIAIWTETGVGRNIIALNPKRLSERTLIPDLSWFAKVDAAALTLSYGGEELRYDLEALVEPVEVTIQGKKAWVHLRTRHEPLPAVLTLIAVDHDRFPRSETLRRMVALVELSIDAGQHDVQLSPGRPLRLQGFQFRIDENQSGMEEGVRLKVVRNFSRRLVWVGGCLLPLALLVLVIQGLRKGGRDA